mmetsp:Transcript_121534/g.343839  ORF Transcript_121534/g.343839 Transcript_121534/m.343839 type:complete len:206 (-) Transcript_121534:1344-1961(-)
MSTSSGTNMARGSQPCATTSSPRSAHLKPYTQPFCASVSKACTSSPTATGISPYSRVSGSNASAARRATVGTRSASCTEAALGDRPQTWASGAADAVPHAASRSAAPVASAASGASFVTRSGAAAELSLASSVTRSGAVAAELSLALPGGPIDQSPSSGTCEIGTLSLKGPLSFPAACCGGGVRADACLSSVPSATKPSTQPMAG